MMIKSTKQQLIVLTLVTAISACSQQESAQTYISQAKSALAEQNIQSSVIALKNAIQVEPSNAEARFLLGEIYLSQGNALSAIKELSIADRSKYLPEKVRPLLSRAHYLAEEYDAVLDISEEGLQANSLLSSQLYKALVLVQQSKKDEALKLLLTMKQAAENNGYTLLADAFFQLSNQDVDLAKQLAEEALSKIPSQPEAILLLANIASINEDYIAAADNYRKYLALQHMQRTSELLLANVLLKGGELEQAEKHADNILKLIPNQPLANYVKAMVRVQNADYELAHRHAELALNNKFNQPNLKLVAGVSAFYLKKHEQVLNYIQPLLNYLPAEHFARKMLVVSQIELGIIEDVTNTLGNIEGDASGNKEFYSTLSYKLLKAGALEEAKKVLDTVDVDEQSAPQLLKDGMLKLMLNDEGALNSLEKAVELDPQLAQAELAIAYTAVNAGNFPKADAIAHKWQKNNPDKPDGYNLAAAIAIKQDKKLVAKKLLEQSNSKEKNVYALMMLAQLAQEVGDKAQVKDLIKQAKVIEPNNVRVLRADIQLDETETALNELREKIKHSPKNISLKLIYAEALMRLKKVDEALNSISDIEPTIDTPKFYWQLKVAGNRFNNNLNLVQKTLKGWRDINPYHIEPIIYLAEVYVAKKDYDNAIRVIDEGITKHKNNLTLKLVKTEVLLNKQDVSAANILWSEIEQRVADGYTKSGLKGRLALLNKDFKIARKELAPVYRNQPTVRNVLLLSSALIGDDSKPESITLLNQHLRQQSYHPQVASLLGTLYLEASDGPNALNVYESMTKQQPDNVVALNNAAWLNMEKGELVKAKRFAERAIELAPEIPNVVDTYGKILLKAGDNRMALTQAAKAYELSNGVDVDIALNYVEILIVNKRKNKASQVLGAIKNPNKNQEQRRIALEKELAS
ncbi:PEP-CTERM system TPR-repeat protein PrsT [Thalassotalea sp. M1531]|uniref:PEP-CTERM system TPR-repeat protein PrsT n=1 Tax=Thalassotalea algicola TaxID=2716224 RepID=A0A7Y0Q679_9GAMM|nr:XrtA/PEP-CTERM system TPR-repeat protein PrsT [Thalassotalea algicola]NMP30542.1 PEP-CTERM system TPR-repeat protein PrsT [Thalassotalea algicola]